MQYLSKRNTSSNGAGSLVKAIADGLIAAELHRRTKADLPASSSLKLATSPVESGASKS